MTDVQTRADRNQVGVDLDEQEQVEARAFVEECVEAMWMAVESGRVPMGGLELTREIEVQGSTYSFTVEARWSEQWCGAGW